MTTELEKLVRENRAPKELAEAVKTGEKKSRAVSENGRTSIQSNRSSS